MLSRFSKKIHDALTKEKKDELSQAFESIKSSFRGTSEYKQFFDVFSESIKDSVRGFVHKLDVDFSAYDPNNYAKSLRIIATENDECRSFDEFGTGEQQVLVLAFVKAYMKVFNGQNFILLIEEPEAHLHPLAQRWLKEYVSQMRESGLQVVISTHSPEFVVPENLEGLVRVFKEDGITKVKQVSKANLVQFLVETGVPQSIINETNVIPYYVTKVFSDQLKGFFAENVILVEGATEYHTLPIWLKRVNYSLAEHGTDIIWCNGKPAIPLFWRLYKAFGYNCFIIFDCDKDSNGTKKIFPFLNQIWNFGIEQDKFYIESEFAYFGKDYESFFKSKISNYEQLSRVLTQKYCISGNKPGIARAIAMESEEIPAEISELKEKLLDFEGNNYQINDNYFECPF